ncbi:DUF1127 domain-containing protein [Dongia sedimenti]|uniref:DUF1127 domain-containing protein n=1 Tax=Dongia sedimenti TaxID=3064282 RepID=A0ABU0YFH8_9PROT|nr:DUF1127 domain-containing protein [Rhodospirillaceae bacterium R-7]
MAEMTDLSRGHSHRNGTVGGLFAGLRLGLSRLFPGRATRLHLDAWPDYLLRDIGLDRASRDPADPRPTDWLGR